jgi:glycosyltransferase involved in cell wall biosynthesis
MTPLVSVIIPTYNRKEFIGPAIDSVLAQTFKDFEIIVVDDGSTDGTVDFIQRRYSSSVRLHAIPHSGLPAVGRNAGLAIARGSLIAFLDSDDLWLPQKLAIQVKAATEDSESVLFFGKAETLCEGSTQSLIVPADHELPKRLFERQLFQNYVPVITAMVRHDVLRQMGGFNPKPGYRAIEDYDLWLRITYHYPVHFIPQILARYRLHDESISHGTMARFDRYETVLIDLFKTFKVHPALYHKALAQLDIARSKYILRSPRSSARAITFLKRALSNDPWNPLALCLYGVTLCGGSDLLRLFLVHFRKQVHT